MNKTFEVIPIEDYGVVVDKSQRPKDRTKCIGYHKDTGKPLLDDHYYEEDEVYYKYPCDMIIATINKRIDDIPFIEINEMEILANECAEDEGKYNLDKVRARINFIKGYKAATKKYSEEDINEAFARGYMLGKNKTSEKEYGETFLGFIKSLQPKLPKSVTLKMGITHADRAPNGFETWVEITNPSTNTIIPISYD